MALIKSHSNYVLKSKHQNVSDGTIWERDITTIGGVNQFSPGQVPIYRSNNFIISVRNDGKVSNQFNRPKWYENTEGSIWTLENVNEMASSFEENNDVKIVLKQDYYDFNDFAYYGSLSELFRASINDIFERFPGELYVTTEETAYYTISYTKDLETYQEKIPFDASGNNKYVSNPYGIDVHSKKKPTDAKSIKYFAENGYENYRVQNSNGKWENIVNWETEYYDLCCNEDSLKAYGSVIQYDDNGIGVVIGSCDVGGCVNGEVNVELDSEYGWIRNLSVNGKNIIADVDENSTDGNRTAFITVSLTTPNNEVFEQKIKVKQLKYEKICTCDKLTIQKSANSISYFAGTYVIGSYRIKPSAQGKCFETINVEVVDSDANWITSAYTQGNEIKIKVEENSNEQEDRTAEIRVFSESEDGTCESTFQITQIKHDEICRCNTLNVTPSGDIPYSSGRNVVIGRCSRTCLNRLGAFADVSASWVTNLSVNNDVVTANVSENNTNDNRYATITVSGRTENETCSTTFTIKQTPKNCECNEFIVEKDTDVDSLDTIDRGARIKSRSSENIDRKIAKITITTDASNEYVIYACLGDNKSIVYISKNVDVHIRPNEDFLSEFYNECNNFEKIILDYKTTPKYKAIFSVIDDNEYGYYRKMEEFIFPTSYGGYNLDASNYGFNTYTTRLSEIGEYYDEFFTDNLYRSMTHEAIKNFDWTFTREFYEGQDEEYVLGGERIQKALRIFAREFDEIKSYIDNISNYNRITYDERSNVPDYFLTDMVGNDGWDVKLVMPYDLKEVYLDDRSDVGETAYTRDFQLNNSTYEWDEEFTTKSNEKYFVRQFSQVSDKEVFPYSKDKLPEDIRDGYFIVCGEGDVTEGVPCGYGDNYHFKKTDEENKFTYIDEDSDNPDTRFKYRIKSYTEKKPYTYFEANKEFLRRLKINSPYIWRHKGTIEGIEMILGMFGLKSRRWVEANSNCKYSDKKNYDYDIVEYSSFTNRIEEQWDAAHQMYRIDWFNSTKTITYDYRLVSKYSSNGMNEYSYMSYQGIPVAYRDEYEYSDNFVNRATNYSPYIKIGSIGNQTHTNNKSEAFKEISKNNAPVKRRYLYPQFNKDEQLDGNPYFQMDGGWLSKTIGSNETTYNFQFDIDDNVVYTKKIYSGYTKEDATIVDDRPLFKETVRNIRMVDGINELLNIPKLELYNGIIIYVARIDKDIATIGNTVYNIKYEYNETDPNNPLKYVELTKSDGFISPTFGMYFDDTIIVYGKNKNPNTGKIEGIEIERDVKNMEDGTILKAYIFEDQAIPFVCKSDENAYVVNSFSMVITEEDDTNYFILEDVEHNDTLINKGNEGWSYGWRRLKKHDCDFLKINTIENYYKGNNPHNGRMVYDSGHEYFTYFNRIFKHAHDNNLFDDRCFGESITNDFEYNDYLAEANGYGFNGLIDKEEKIKQYTPFLVSGDTKIRYFGNYKTRDKNTNKIDEIYIYGENQEKIYNDEIRYGHDSEDYIGAVTSYTLKNYSNNPNPFIDLQNGTNFKLWNDDIDTDIIDESTNQIMNNKRLSIIFNLKSKNWYSNSGQTEVKYLDNIVMNYLTQMLPSTVIVDVYYKDNEDAVEPDTRTVVESECVSQE